MQADTPTTHTQPIPHDTRYICARCGTPGALYPNCATCEAGLAATAPDEPLLFWRGILWAVPLSLLAWGVILWILARVWRKGGL